MSCPYCHTELSQDDGKTFLHVGKELLKVTNPIGLVDGMFRVGKTIYYDFSNIPKTDEYLYCQVCNVYFIRCCHCGHLNCIGSDIMVSPKKIKCSKCTKEYVYATHPEDTGLDTWDRL